MSGLDVCRAIRANPETSAIPVLMLTVRHDDTDVVAGMEAGADDYVAKDAAGALILGRVRRLIEFRQMSGLAMLNQQLAQVGRLLAGIVHEIRGPLAVIRGNAELLQMTAVAGQEEEQWIDSILRSSRILQVRLEHLMAAVRKGSSEVHVTDPSAPILEAIDLFVKGLPPRDQPVRIEAVLGADVPKVQVDPGRLMQVLLNLLSNGHEAITRAHGTGRIVASTGVAKAEGRSWVTIDVRDDGPGVPEAYIDRIFEPFFTTREEGTGYGLYLAAAILKEQSGRIMVRNNPEGGDRSRSGCPWPSPTWWLPTRPKASSTRSTFRIRSETVEFVISRSQIRAWCSSPHGSTETRRSHVLSLLPVNANPAVLGLDESFVLCRRCVRISLGGFDAFRPGQGYR